MKFFGRLRLVVIPACFCVVSSCPALLAQQQPAAPAPAPAPQQQPPAPPPKTNPFESIPAAQQPAPASLAPAPSPAPRSGQVPRLEVPKDAPTSTASLNGQTIEAFEFRGAKRVPQDTLKALILSKPGDLYSEDTLRRDFMILWNTGRFDDIRLEAEPGRLGLIIRFVLTERRVIRSIEYPGAKSVTVSEILDRFKERKVGLSVESQYDPNKIQRASVVLKEFLAERGRQYATVEPQIEQIPPSSLKVSFVVNEGPKVKVGLIEITGNTAKDDRWVIRNMKNSKGIGIPHSILFESIFPSTYDRAKLDEDKDRVRQAYQDAGYFVAKTLEETVDIRHRGGRGWRLPLLKMNLPGITANITLPVEEGKLYHLRNMNFTGVKLFKAPEALMKPLFGMTTGDIFSTDKLRKGIENMRKLYGRMGYIDFVPEPEFHPAEDGSDQIDLTLTADEGKQFFIRRIDFSGNTTTRDKVIRREILLDEGQIFNSELWDYSILRLNQLGYFEMLKKEESADIKRNPQSNTVDITLKVKERGKNSIGLNGGVSGISGSFVGFNYSTNNFLGLGETLSVESQLGTRTRDVSLGFTEPYFLDRPLQLGFVVYLKRFNYNQGREASILSGSNLIPLYNQLGSQNLLNYTQNSHGVSLSASYPIKRTFARVGITYGFDISNVVTTTDAAKAYFQYINFSGVAGPNSLTGIRTSHVVPSYTYNTVNHPMTPTAGRSVFFSVDFAGSILGGNINTIRPSLDVKYFKAAPWHRSHILAFHGLASMITGYGGKYIAPFSRTFIGGEQDIRGFENWGVTPIAYVASSASVNVLNDDGSSRTQKVVQNGVISNVAVTMNVPRYQLITPGGDTQVVSNFEYRIPIVGPVTMALFGDAGVNRILRASQLNMEPSRVRDLNNEFPQAGFNGRVQIAPGTQKPRVSTGLELQVMLPVVNAPFRLYWAYNPSVVRQYLQPPIVADRSFFPNQSTFINSVASFGQAYPYYEKRSTFRFTIGRTF